MPLAQEKKLVITVFVYYTYLYIKLNELLHIIKQDLYEISRYVLSCVL